MAHEIEKTDAFGEVRKGKAFGEERGQAWHGLGDELEQGLTTWEGFEKLGMGWDSELCPLTTTFKGEQISLPDFRAHVRMDTKGILGVVSKAYKPISNRSLAEFADALVGADKAVTLETGGSLRNGRRVFALIKLPTDTVVLGEDHLKNYVCVSNGHDGENAFRVFFTPIRVVCANTLAMAEAHVGGAKFAHDGDVKNKMELARAALGIIVNQSKVFAQQAQTMAKVKLKTEEIASYFTSVYDKTFEGTEEKHTRDTMAKWNANMERGDNVVKATRGTLWQAFNAVTFFHDHERGRMKAVRESSGRIHSNLFGVSADDKRIALREALALVK